MKDFDQAVTSLTNEYVAKDGVVTAEFSTSRENLDAKLVILKKADGVLAECRKSLWVVFECSTCKGYDAAKPLHCMILQEESIPEIDHELLKGREYETSDPCSVPRRGL